MNDNPELAELYREHQRRLFGHAWQLTGNAAEAEDVVQETFLRALRSWQSYQERGRGGAWLLRILVNVARERGRRATLYRWRVHPELTLSAGSGLDPGPSPEERLASAEASRRALRALAGLTVELREVLVLRHFEDRSTADVALILGLPEATVRSRLKRARDVVLRSCEREETCEREVASGGDDDQEGQGQ
jgi:RNA polymerase sigma-70 factor (ECF subfamily)